MVRKAGIGYFPKHLRFLAGLLKATHRISKMALFNWGARWQEILPQCTTRCFVYNQKDTIQGNIRKSTAFGSTRIAEILCPLLEYGLGIAKSTHKGLGMGLKP